MAERLEMTDRHTELRSSILNRLQVATLALSAIVDYPANADDVQRRAAQVIKQIVVIAAEVRELAAVEGEEESSEAVGSDN